MAASIKFCVLRRLLRRVNNKKFIRQIATRANNNFDEEDNTTTTHFGFQTVTEEEKEEKVYEVFRNVADKYDLMNDAMSVGVHRLWKDHFIRRLSPLPGTKLIDVAGGTGDIAFRFLKSVETRQRLKSGEELMPPDTEPLRTAAIETQDPGEPTSDSASESSSDEELLGNKPLCHVTVCDINQSMLNVGKQRAAEAGFHTGIAWLKGNAECLPVADNTFDAYTIAFGIRNCTHLDKVVEEAYRVLKPGGRFMCLEFSQVSNPLIRSAYDEYSFQVIPVLGQVLAGDWSSYQYLVESIRQFPDQEDFKELIQQSGFRAVTYENLTFGVTAIHSGFKL